MNRAVVQPRLTSDGVFISIITVCKNNKEGLVRTWESVELQETKDWEWIVIDGVSVDGTLSFLNELSDPKVKYISEPDKGLYDAMNKGIERSSGQYILFLNSGDQLQNSNVINVIKHSATQNEFPDFLYGDSYEMTPFNDLRYKRARSYRTVWYGMFTHHQAMVYKRSSIKHIRYRLEYPIGADYAFTAEFLRARARSCYIPIPICIFEQGGLSFTNQKQGEEDQWHIRKDILRVPWLLRILVKFLHVTIFRFKKSFPKYYEKVRFTYGK